MRTPLFTLLFSLTAITCAVGQSPTDLAGVPNAAVAAAANEETTAVAKSGANAPIIINVIPSPIQSTYLGDIAFDGEYLWVEGYDEFLLYQISPVDGSIIRSIPSTVVRPYGLAFDGNALWLADNDNRLIHQIDTADGAILQTYSTPSSSVTSYPNGLAWDGNNLWHNDPNGPMTTATGDSSFYITTNGSVLQSHQAKGQYPTGLAFDGQYLWSSDNDRRELYKIDASTFTVLDTIDAPGGNFPNGLAFDGQYLWVANNDSDSIYQLRIGVSIKDVDEHPLTAHQFTLYPNPASSQLNIVSEQPGPYHVTILSVTGQVIQLFPKSSGSIDIEALPKGNYLVQIEVDGQTITKQLVKR